ncbi:hypothetical protein [Streptomyces sp. AC558_RSS880]|uniref:hypothetical protein n=1 Tax=Streptomyces sp. AC558_RSS880 TaxID=2823687 RepID=UPI001C2218C0|nr:hypothetical protein [Streptomyces sp. AC558_RSS880]
MSEQPAFADDFSAWLTERGVDAYALVWVARAGESAGWPDSEVPRVGESGIARLGADLTRLTLEEVTHGPQETLRRWLQRDDGARTLTIVSADSGGLCEHTPGELAARLRDDPAGDQTQLTGMLADWLHRTELVEDWQSAASLVVDVPVLKETADWLLDQIALRDASAQQLRAVLEPDLTDYLHDRQAAPSLPDAPAPVLDAPRTAHLAQARETVRTYTAAVHAGHFQQAQYFLDTFPAPARPLTISGPAATWRQHSATARQAVTDLAAQRAATTAEDNIAYVTDPELLHAQTSYLAAREGQLHLLHDALGRLAFPAPTPVVDLPEDLVPAVAAQTQRRLIEAFGTPKRAYEVLDGRIAYLQQQPTPAHRAEETPTELALLHSARTALQTQLTGIASTSFDGNEIARRVNEVMANSRKDPQWRPFSAEDNERRAQRFQSLRASAFEEETITPPGSGIRP